MEIDHVDPKKVVKMMNAWLEGFCHYYIYSIVKRKFAKSGDKVAKLDSFEKAEMIRIFNRAIHYTRVRIDKSDYARSEWFENLHSKLEDSAMVDRDYHVGQWFQYQRRKYHKGDYPTHLQTLMDMIGFPWGRLKTEIAASKKENK